MLKYEYIVYPMHVLKHQLFLLEQYSDSFEIWSAIILDLHLGSILDYELRASSIVLNC